jgi:hypothetical protein
MKISAGDILIPGREAGMGDFSSWWESLCANPSGSWTASMFCVTSPLQQQTIPNPPLVTPASPVSSSTQVTPRMVASLTDPTMWTPADVLGTTAAAQEQATTVYQNVLAQTSSTPPPPSKCSWYQTQNPDTGLCETGGTAVILIAAGAAMFIMVMGSKK